MSNDKPRPFVTVVIETHEALEQGDVAFESQFDALDRQTYPRERFAVIVVVSDPPAWLEQVVAKRPEVRLLRIDAKSYFEMKVAGADAAQGEVIAFLDSDARPVDVWLERLVHAIEQGADVAVGKVRYPPGTFSRWLNLADWSHVYRRADGSATTIVATSMAIRTEVWRVQPFDVRLRRTGACYLLGQQLRRAGRTLAYVPEAAVSHTSRYEGRDFFTRRLRGGYDSIMVGRLSAPGTTNEAKAARLGVAAPLGLFAGRLVADVRAILRQHEDLEFRRVEIPLAISFQIFARAVEAVGAFITVARPNYLARKLDL